MLLKNNKPLVFMGMCVLVVLSGCAKYSAQPLNRLQTAKPNKQDKKDNTEKSVAMSYRVFDKDDCKKYLNRDVIAKGYQPIQITITNNTDRYINISKSNFSLPTVAALDVAKHVHTSTSTRVLSYGVAGLFLWPFLIPAAVDGMKSSEANHRLDDDFARKELSDQVVAPFNTINGLIFVPKSEFKPEFTITAVDVENRTKLVLNSEEQYLKV